MSVNFNFAAAIEEGLRLGKERLATKDRINEILKTFADALQKILSDDSKQEIFVQKRHIVIRKKLSKLAAIAVISETVFKNVKFEAEKIAESVNDK